MILGARFVNIRPDDRPDQRNALGGGGALRYGLAA